VRLMPENVSSFGGAIDSLALLITVLVGIGLLAAEGVLVYSLLRFRRRGETRAGHLTGDSWRQARWVVIPVLVVALGDFFIDARTSVAWERIKGTVPRADRVVGITAQQYTYTFTYPGPDGVLGTADDIVSNELHVPVNETVVFELRAKDMVHSFWVPALRLKQDAVPGRTIRGWFQATKTGRFETACAQICGVGHTMMRSTLFVDSVPDYERWLAAATRAALVAPAAGGAPLSPLAAEGLEVLRAKGCLACHNLDGSRTLAPTYLGIYGRPTLVVTAGRERTVVADEAYLRRSILDPQADVVKGYPAVMPKIPLSDREVAAIVEFLKHAH
jgi:cytochrome c oxidase subunit 2